MCRFYSVDRNVLYLDAERKSVAIKYCLDDWLNLPAKLALEKIMFMNTQRINARAKCT